MYDKENNSEAGVALLEFAIVAAGLLFGFLLFIDVCFAICNYFTLSGIAAEAVRTGARVPELEASPPSYGDIITGLRPVTSNFPTSADQAACDNLTATTYACGHNTIHSRIKTMLDLVELQVTPTSINYTTELIPLSSGGIDADTVIVRIAARYPGIILVNWPVRVQAQGPYLFQ